MASASIIFVVLAMCVAAALGGILPVATSFSSQTINHAVATPIAAAPIVAAPASYVAPYTAAYTAAYSYPYSYTYPYAYTHPYYF